VDLGAGGDAAQLLQLLQLTDACIHLLQAAEFEQLGDLCDRGQSYKIPAGFPPRNKLPLQL